MQELIIDALRAKLEALPFVSQFGGLAQTLSTVDTLSKPKRFPVSAADNKPLTPDGKQAGVMYFEHMRLDTKGFDRTALAVESLMRCVYWGKLEGAGNIAAAQLAVIKCVPEAMYNPRPLFKCTHVVSRIVLPQDGLFEKYTYSEETNQYLLTPYTAFGIEIKTTFNIPLTCVPQ